MAVNIITEIIATHTFIRLISAPPSFVIAHTDTRYYISYTENNPFSLLTAASNITIVTIGVNQPLPKECSQMLIL
jgi:hypothetical protein